MKVNLHVAYGEAIQLVGAGDVHAVTLERERRQWPVKESHRGRNGMTSQGSNVHVALAVMPITPCAVELAFLHGGGHDDVGCEKY